MQEETIKVENGHSYNLPTKWIDRAVWQEVYRKGYTVPNHPVPALNYQKVRCANNGFWALYFYLMGYVHSIEL